MLRELASRRPPVAAATTNRLDPSLSTVEDSTYYEESYPSGPTGRRRTLIGAWWLLPVILAIQAALSARLIWSNTAFQDEALYLWAGRLEWSHWLHGTPVPLFPAYFSGAPVLYPPLGALANSLGGLAGARLLSLAFMLGATALLWPVTTKLYSRRAAFFACALWAVLGPTVVLGAFATFDPLSQLLIALSVWLLVRAGPKGEANRWIFLAAVALALANVTTYSTAIFDPVVIGIAVLRAYPDPGGKAALRRGAGMLAYTMVLLVSLSVVARSYDVGVEQTVLARASGTDSPLSVLMSGAEWIAPVLILALAGAAIGYFRRPAGTRWALAVLLAAAALLTPIEQARIHTVTSLDKHADMGAWFAAIAAGYAVDFLIGAAKPKALRTVWACVCGLLLALPLALGFQQARGLYDWPNSAVFVTVMRTLSHGDGSLLVETPTVAQYYLPVGDQWQRWSNTFSITTLSGKAVGQTGVTLSGNPAVYEQYIARGYFSVVALNGAATPTLDRQLAVVLDHSNEYELAVVVPYGSGEYQVWRRNPAASGPKDATGRGTHGR